MDSASILLVEDQAVIRGLMRRLLAPRGYHILEAADLHGAREAVERNGTCHLVIADRRLPDGDGASFARSLYERGLVLGVIVTSGETVSETWPGLASVLPKPFSADALVKAVEHALSTLPAGA